jgi:hypothetical protein
VDGLVVLLAYIVGPALAVRVIRFAWRHPQSRHRPPSARRNVPNLLVREAPNITVAASSRLSGNAKDRTAAGTIIEATEHLVCWSTSGGAIAPARDRSTDLRTGGSP